MLKRKIINQMIEWKFRANHGALLIKGARQVGKTTSIRLFAKEQYQNFIEINFEREPQLKEIFDGSLNANSIILKMSASGLGPFVPRETLIFFDEIQSCPNARTAIKFLVEDGKYDYIESGSLLGINYKEVSSYPVGFEEHITMSSLDFEEFLWAVGIGEAVIDHLRVCFEKKEKVEPFIHKQITERFHEYMVIGGMPQVINEYLATSDMQRVVAVQKNIIASYRDDISKYAKGNKVKAKEVFDVIPYQLMKKNNRFYFTSMSKEKTLRSYEGALMWLHDAGIARMCCNVSSPSFPLVLNEKRNIFKLFLCDTGLLSAMCYPNVQKEILLGNISVNEGAIMENMIADMLLKNEHSLYYYDCKKPKSMEVDFLITYQNSIQPIEVKSGKAYRKHDSLSNLIKTNSDLAQPMILCQDNVFIDREFLYLPLYMAMFLHD